MKRLRYILLPLLAAAGIMLAAYSVHKQNQPIPTQPIPLAPNASPFLSRVAGVGTVEPSSELIQVGTAISGIVESVRVKEGDRVRAGDVLLTIDTRDATARLAVAEAELAVAETQLADMKALPRKEDLDRAEANVVARRERLQDAEGRLDRLVRVGAEAGVAANERPTLEFQVALMRAELESAEADLAKVRIGAYPEEMQIKEAQVSLARSRRDEAATTLERLKVRSPIDATVLSVQTRAGEFAASGPQAPRLLALGSLTPLNLRVDIDELDAWRFDPTGRAVAYLRGGERREYPLTYVRTVPMVSPKRTLSGEMGERLDTRVMQVIYSFSDSGAAAGSLKPGQVLDVFIERPTP